jgi:acyl-CoA reductase-like NAD-dependent aldehyde dehydrogenase
MFPAPLKSSSDYSRIINTVHTSRLVSFIEESDKEELAKRGEILIGGEFDVEDKFIEPTIFRNTNLDAKIMQDEIFGPLLPVVEVDNVDEAINIVNDRPKPLALYLFSEDQSVVDRVIQQTSSGAVSVNDVLMHFAVESLPFGGVGESGMGCYKGKASFDTFSHKKPILHQSGRSLCDPYFRYPPFDEKKQWIMKKFF